MAKAQDILVSVKCDVFNQVNYIRQALDSILSQKTNFNFEIIIHDDASTDGTQDVLKEYQNKYPDIITLILEKENQYTKIGFFGINKIVYPYCKGKYIALCEGDDYWTDNQKLQEQVDFMECHPDCSFCFHNALIKYENSQKTDKVFSNFKSGFFTASDLLNSWIAPTASFFFRRTVIESKEYKRVLDSKKLMYGDLPLILSGTCTGKVYGYNKVMSVYRKNDGGVMNLHRKLNHKILAHHIEMGKIFGDEIKPFRNKYIGECAVIALSKILHKEDGLRENLKTIIHAFCTSPSSTIKHIRRYS